MSTAIDEFFSPTQEVPRDRFGRPLVTPPGGGKPVGYVRATTWADTLEDKFNLQKWESRMVALGIASRDDLRYAVAAHRDDKSKLDEICRDAKEAAKGSAGATTGTALHILTEQLDRGTLDMTHVPADLRPDITAYRTVTAALRMKQIEQFGVLDDIKVAGTWDRIVTLDGRNYIADLKTGSIEFGMGKIAAQLAIYAHATPYDFTTKTRSTPNAEAGVDQDRALVIHLPASTGRCELHWIDINAGWEAVDLARQVRAWRARKQLASPFSPPAAETGLFDRIAAAPDLIALTTLWRDNASTWTPAHTAAAARRKNELT